jgi:hypothetical protein
MSAAVEFAIYNAQRPLLPGRLPSRSVHAPARRIARTLVCLGRQVRVCICIGTAGSLAADGNSTAVYPAVLTHSA